MFKRLTVEGWRQFHQVDINFHDRLTVLTGANGAGKTTLLHLLNRHWGWNIPFVSTPKFELGTRKYWAGFWGRDTEAFEPALTDQEKIGEIEYSHVDQIAEITIGRKVEDTFQTNIRPMATVHGVYVSSHRPLYLPHKVDQIPTMVDEREQIFNHYINELRNRYAVNTRVQSPSFKLKQALISLATFGYGNEAVIPNDEARDSFEGFQTVLERVLPSSLGFRGLKVSVPDVLLETTSGEFAFDAVSGGISALIDISWQMHLYSRLHPEFVAVIDEPEAHLHPELQQRVLPSLLEAFPGVQLVVATHNPFVVGSTPDSSVYALRYNADGTVASEVLSDINKAGTSNEILREVLGLETTSGLWVGRRVREIVERYWGSELSSEILRKVRDELRLVGLGRYVPDAIEQLVDSGDDE